MSTIPTELGQTALTSVQFDLSAKSAFRRHCKAKNCNVCEKRISVSTISLATGEHENLGILAVWSISRVNPVAHEGAEALALILRARDAAAVPVAPWEAAHELQSRRHVDPACGHAAVAAGLAMYV